MEAVWVKLLFKVHCEEELVREQEGLSEPRIRAGDHRQPVSDLRPRFILWHRRRSVVVSAPLKEVCRQAERDQRVLDRPEDRMDPDRARIRVEVGGWRRSQRSVRHFFLSL